MAEKFELEFDDTALLAAFARIQVALEATDGKFSEMANTGEKSMTELELATKELQDQFKGMTAKIAELEEALKKKQEEEKKNVKSTQLMTDASAKLDEALGGTVGKVKAALTATKAYLAELRASTTATIAAARANVQAAAATGKFGNVMKALVPSMKLVRGAMLAIPIFALIAAITAVITYLTRFQGGMDALAKAMAQAGAVMDVIIDRVATFGKAIVSVFQGDLKGAGESLTATFKGVGDQVRDVAKAVGELQDARVRLRNEMISTIQLEGQLTRKIEEQKLIAEDASLAEEQRIAAAQEALNATNQLYDIQIARAKEYARILFEEGEQTNSNADQIEAIERAAAAVSELEAERASRLKETRNQMVAITQQTQAKIAEAHKAEQERVMKLREEYQALEDQLSERSQAARLNLLNAIDRAFAERDIAVAQLEKLRQDLINAATKAGLEPPADLDAQVAAALADINQALEKAIKDNRPDVTVLEKLVLGPEGTIDPAAVNRFAAQTDRYMQQGLEDAQRRITPFLARWRADLADMLGITEAEMDLAFDFAREAVFAITDFTAQATQQRIEMYAMEADALRASRDEIRSELEKEKQEQAAGNANRVAELEARLKAEEAALFAAEQRRLDEERKAANRRLVFDSIQQASKLALAAANVITAESSRGLLGILTAAGGIALLFSIMAGAKANAAKASQIPKLRMGGETPEIGEVKGPSHEQGGIIATIDGRPVVEIEGGERVVDKKRSKKYRPFFEELKQGKYDHLERLTIVDPTRPGASRYMQIEPRQHTERLRIVHPGRSVLSGMASQIRSYEAKGLDDNQALAAALMEKAYTKAAQDATKQLIDYWKGRPVVRPLDGWVETWEVGNTKQRKVVRKGG